MSTTTAIRIGIVGAGANTRSRHIPNLKVQAGVEIVSAHLFRIIRDAGRTPVERDTLYNVVAEGAALAADKPFRRDVRRTLEVVS